MRFSKALILYQDEPEYGRFLELIILITPAALLVASFYSFSSGDTDGSLALLLGAFLIGVIFLVVFPRQYQVREDHLRIVLGGPFSIKIKFDRIKSVAVASKLAFGVNFATKLTGSYVEITLKKGLSIAITPRNNNLFVENANRALSEWAKTSNQSY